MLAAAPSCTNGAFAALDPLVRTFWYNNVLEGQPIWHLPWDEIAFKGVPSLIGLVASVRLWMRATTSAERTWWLELTLILLAATIIGVLVARATAASAMLATVPSAWQLRERIDAMNTAAGPVWRRLLRAITVPILIFPGLPVLAAEAAMPAKDAGAPLPVNAPRGYAQSACDFDKLGEGLRRLPVTDIFAPLDLGPRIIVDTPHRVIATGHHRGLAGIHDVIAAFIAPPDLARAIIARHHATIVLICPDQFEADNYRNAGPKGLMAGLLSNHAPRWLTPIDLAPGSQFKAWRVVAVVAQSRKR
jgi:hypothetical protein